MNQMTRIDPALEAKMANAIRALAMAAVEAAKSGHPGAPMGMADVATVLRTRCDALAIACGTSHGAYKFTRKPDGEVLAMHVIQAIHDRLPGTHLVMHGSSSVPQHLQDLINASGGQMPQTYGVPVEEIERGIRMGVRKVNIDTDCRMAMTGHFRKVARDRLDEFDPRKFMIPAMAELTALCRDRFERFGTAGQAHRIKVIAMDEMAKRYASGALDPAITGAKAA